MIQQRIRSRGADTKETEVKTRSLLRARAGQLCESFEGRRQGNHISTYFKHLKMFKCKNVK